MATSQTTSDHSIVVDTTPKKKSTKSANAQPKSACSAFLLFSKAERANVKREHPDASFGELSKHIGEMWKAADAETKGMYNTLHAANKAKVDADRQACVDTTTRTVVDASAVSSDPPKEPTVASTAPAHATGRVAKSRRPSDPNAQPKSACSAFLLFSKAERANVKREHPDASFGELSKHIGEMWKAADAETKGMYNTLHAANKAKVDADRQVCADATTEDATAFPPAPPHEPTAFPPAPPHEPTVVAPAPPHEPTVVAPAPVIAKSKRPASGTKKTKQTS